MVVKQINKNMDKNIILETYQIPFSKAKCVSVRFFFGGFQRKIN